MIYRDTTFLQESHNEVKEICKPLMKNLNINYFSYVKLDSSLKTTLLTTNPEVVEFIRENKIVLSAENSLNPLVHNIVYYDDIDQTTKLYRDFLKPIKDEFDISHLITISRLRSGFYEFFTFGTNEKNSGFKELFILNKSYIESFLPYFKTKAAGLIKTATKFSNHGSRAILYQTFMKMLKNNQNMSCKEIFRKIEKRDVLLDEHDFKICRIKLDEPFDNIYLTRKEIGVIRLLEQNLTMKKIAQQLGVSWTTIRSHIDKLRYKLNCKSKSDLINLLSNSTIIDNVSYAIPSNEIDKKAIYQFYAEVIKDFDHS